MRRRAIVGTAAVGGLAYAAGHSSGTKSAQQQYTDEQQSAQIAELQQQQSMQQQPVYQQPVPPPTAPAPASPGGLGPDTIEQLKQLGALHDANILSEAEFDVAKKKILGDL